MTVIVYFTDRHTRYMEDIDEIIQDKHRIIFNNPQSSVEYDTRKITNIVINDFFQERVVY